MGLLAPRVLILILPGTHQSRIGQGLASVVGNPSCCIATLEGVDASGSAPADDPVYPRAMSLKAAALYQMGNYEHALLNYHRADR